MAEIASFVVNTFDSFTGCCSRKPSGYMALNLRVCVR